MQHLLQEQERLRAAAEANLRAAQLQLQQHIQQPPQQPQQMHMQFPHPHPLQFPQRQHLPTLQQFPEQQPMIPAQLQQMYQPQQQQMYQQQQQQMYQPQQQLMHQPQQPQIRHSMSMVELYQLRTELAGLREEQKTAAGQESGSIARRIGELEYKIAIMAMSF
jgi:hypothetical protein